MKNKNTFIALGFFILLLLAVISLFSNSLTQKASLDEIISLAPTNGLSQPGTTTPTPTPSSNQPDPTADWKTYAVPFLHSSVKVPPNWFIATDETDKNHIRILSSSPEASPEAAQAGFMLDINKIQGATKMKNIVDLRIELTKDSYKDFTQKGKIAGETEVKIDTQPGLYRELQTQTGAIQQLYVITSTGEMGIFESIPKDENQINIFKIIISTIKSI